MSPSKLLAGPFNHLRRCRYGYMLYNINDQYIGQSLERYGEYSEGEVDLFRQVIRPGDTVLDVGANCGAHTLFFAQAVGPEGRVFAFEPQRVIFQTLCANLALNSLTNTYCYNAAAGEKRGAIVVPRLNYSMPENYGSLSLGACPDGELVEVRALDNLGLTDCRLIKVDVEGMEAMVLRGAVQTIKQSRPMLYVENDRSENSLELTRFIESLGYEMYWDLPPLFNPQNYYQNAENVFGIQSSVNLFCVHPDLPLSLEGMRRAIPGEPRPRRISLP